MDIARITQIYDQLNTYSIELDGDPTVLGPQYLGKVIAQCRNYLNQTVFILLEIRREKQLVSNRLSSEKTIFKIESDNLLSGDERVRTRPNIRDREAIVNVLLAERLGTINSLENDIRNLEAIESAVKVRHNELVRTDGQIKTQRSLIRDEIETKSFFGDESNSDRQRTTVDEDELEEIMSGSVPPPVRPALASSEIFTVSEPSTPEPTPVVVEVEEPKVQVEPVLEAKPLLEEPAPVVSEIDSALAGAEEALNSSTGSEVSDSEAMNRFLGSSEASPVKEPAAKGRKPKKSTASEVPVPSVVEDPDFADILASIS